MKIIAKKDLFINDEIRVREVRLVGLDGEQLGIKPLSEAQAIADDANVDLVSSNVSIKRNKKNNVRNKALLLLRKFV